MGRTEQCSSCSSQVLQFWSNSNQIRARFQLIFLNRKWYRLVCCNLGINFGFNQSLYRHCMYIRWIFLQQSKSYVGCSILATRLFIWIYNWVLIQNYNDLPPISMQIDTTFMHSSKLSNQSDTPNKKMIRTAAIEMYFKIIT